MSNLLRPHLSCVLLIDTHIWRANICLWDTSSVPQAFGVGSRLPPFSNRIFLVLLAETLLWSANKCSEDASAVLVAFGAGSSDLRNLWATRIFHPLATALL